jgi:hypothetical protein
METGREVQAVPGECIPVSAKKSIGVIVLALVCLPVGLVLVWLWWSDTMIPLITRRMTLWGAVVGAVMVLGGVLIPPLVLWSWLVRKERLVIGTEYLQVVISKGGMDVVKMQIALKNIESVGVHKHFDSTVIAIQLRDVDASDLVPPGGERLTKFKKDFGFHLSIHDSYQLSAKDICRRIEEAMAA